MSGEFDISNMPPEIRKHLGLDDPNKLEEIKKLAKTKKTPSEEDKYDSVTGNSSKIIDRRPDTTIEKELEQIEDEEDNYDNYDNETDSSDNTVYDLTEEADNSDDYYDEDFETEEDVEEEVEEEPEPEPVKKPVGRPAKKKPVETPKETTPEVLEVDEDVANKILEDEMNNDEDPIDRLMSSSNNNYIDVFQDTSSDIFADDKDVIVEKKKEKQKKEQENNQVVNDSYKNVKLTSATNNLDFIDKMVVDLNNIEVSNKYVLSQMDDINAIFSRKSAFNVVCCQSCYSAAMTALTLSDINAINNSNLDTFTHRQRLYKTIYSKIESMNIGKVSFDEWLKITSFGDWDTLLFGVYCQTYPDNNSFDITCGNCGKSTSIQVNNEYLIETRTKEVADKIDSILRTARTPQDIVGSSLVNTSERVFLNNSKIIAEIRTPSLYDHLKLIKSVNKTLINNYPETISSMLFIKQLLIPDIKKIRETGRPVYYPINSLDKMLDILLKLSTEDGEQLEKAMTERQNRYQISYSIQRAVCAHCHQVLPNINVDMETVLFRRINNKTSQEDES